MRTNRRQLLRGVGAAAVQATLIGASGCSEKPKTMDISGAALALTRQIPEDSLKRLAEKRVYFGHQSLGFNMLDGIADLRKSVPAIALKVTETRAASDFAAPVFAHSRIGKNDYPETKIAGFYEVMTQVGDKVDYAGFKMCYEDFGPKTDVQRVLGEYQAAMAKVASTHPKVTLLHFTTPLEVNVGGAKVWLRDLIGRSDYLKTINIRRNQYNDLLRAVYGGKAPLFDLEGVESTLPDGSRTQFKWGGKTYPALTPAYAADRGHLNVPGRQWVAANFLKFLSGLTA